MRARQETEYYVRLRRHCSGVSRRYTPPCPFAIAARKAQQALSNAEAQTFKFHQEYIRLESASGNAARRLQDLNGALEKEGALTRAERLAWQEKIGAAQKKAEEAYLRLDAAQTAHNQLVGHESELRKAHNEAVNVAAGIAKQIGRLSGAGKSTSGLHVTDTKNF